jgi:hypothetical protein
MRHAITGLIVFWESRADRATTDAALGPFDLRRLSLSSSVPEPIQIHWTRAESLPCTGLCAGAVRAP